MNQEQKDLIIYRIQKAKNTFADAKKYFQEVSLESSVNRIYYALFYAVGALLLSKKLYSSKHSGVLALFNREFVNPGLVEKRFGKFYSDMLASRQEGDYKDFVIFEKSEVAQWLAQAEEFIDEIEKLTQQAINQG